MASRGHAAPVVHGRGTPGAVPPGGGRAGQSDPDVVLQPQDGRGEESGGVRQLLHARHDQALPRPLRRHRHRRPLRHARRHREGHEGPAPQGGEGLPDRPQLLQGTPGPLAPARGLQDDVRHGREDRPGPLVPHRARFVPRGRPNGHRLSRDLGHHRPPRPDWRGRPGPREGRRRPLRPRQAPENVRQGRGFLRPRQEVSAVHRPRPDDREGRAGLRREALHVGERLPLPGRRPQVRRERRPD